MRRLFLVLFLAAAFSPVAAQDGGRSGPLDGAQGVRVLGLGGAGSAWLDEPTAIWWNPATLSLAPIRRVELQHTQNALDTRTEQFALVLPTLDYGAWAAAGALQTTTDIIVTGPLSPAPLGTESFNRFRLALGYGFGAPYATHLGAALKVVGYRFMGVERAAWGFDLGVVPLKRSNISVGMVLQNLIRPGFSYADGLEDRWPRRGVIAVAAQPTNRRWLVTGQVEVTQKEDTRFRVGAEFAPVPALALRAGFNGDGPTAGAGVRYRRFRIDYAFLAPSDLGSEHRFGISIDLGIPLSQQRELRDARVRHEVAVALEQRDRELSEDLTVQAETAFAAGDWEAAVRYYSQLQLLFPERAEYGERLTEVSVRRDSLTSERIAATVASATGGERRRVLIAAFQQHQAERQWYAALALLENLKSAGATTALTDSLARVATDSLDRAYGRAMGNGEQALARDETAVAAGWAQAALLHRPGDATATTLLRRAEFQNARQVAVSSLLEAVADGDSASVRGRAQSLLTLDPAHELGRRYLREFSPRAPEVMTTIEDLQEDEEAWEWYTQGFVEFRASNYAEAISWWSRVAERYPNSDATQKNIEQARLRLQTPDEEGNE